MPRTPDPADRTASAGPADRTERTNVVTWNRPYSQGLLRDAASLLKEYVLMNKSRARLMRSDTIVRGQGWRPYWAMASGIVRYGFTAARQIRYSADVDPDRLAIIDDLGQRTYGEVRDDMLALARYWRAKGYGYGTRIGVMARNSRAIIYPLGAKAFIGAHIYLLNVASSPTQLLKSVEEHGLDCLVIDEEFAHHLPRDFAERYGCDVLIGATTTLADAITATTTFDTPNPAWRAMQQVINDAPRQRLPFIPRHGAIVLMSSGTSGTPKAVVHREPLYPTQLAEVIELIPWRAHQVVQQSASIFHSWGWGNVNILFAHRATVVLRRHFDPQQAMEDLVRYKVEGIISSPIFVKEQLAYARRHDSPEFRAAAERIEFVSCSGNAMHEDLIDGLRDYFGPVVCNLYGSTESSVATVASPDHLARYPRTAGKPPMGVRLKILDEKGRELPPNTTGRIHVRSITSMRSYANPRDEMIVRRGLLEIGDRGYVNEEGLLFVEGRIDDMIVVGGENVFPRSVEEVLAPMPGIRDLYVKGVRDDETFARLAVWIVRDPHSDVHVTAEDIRERVRAELADHSVPRDVHFVDALPRNPTGKVMPRMLPGIDG